MSHPETGAKERGFVLIVVLWIMALLGLLGTQLIARARGEAGVAGSAQTAAALQTAADGAVNAAIFGVLTGQLVPNGPPAHTKLGRIDLTSTVTNEAGRINPNSSPFPLLIALLHVCGASRQDASDLATAMLQWRTRAEAAATQYQDAGRPYRPTGVSFQSIDEIGLVLGMTPPLLECLRPRLSLFQESDADPQYADAIVRAALDEAGASGTPLHLLNLAPATLLIRIEVVSRSAGGGAARRSAEVRFAPDPQTGIPRYDILSVASD